jgi:hypothetical protein
MSEETTNPTEDAPEITDADAEGVENPTTDETEVDQDDDGTGDDADNPDGAEDDDSEEIEFEGVKATVPKALAQAIAKGALFQKDYTQKTQAVAAQAKALESREAEITQRAEVYKANIATVAQLHAVDADLEALNALTNDQWEAIKAKDIDTYRDLKDQHRDLKDKRVALQGDLDSKEAEAKQQAAEAETVQFREARQAMGRVVMGLDKTPDGPDLSIPGLTPQTAPVILSKIETFARSALGLTPEDLEQVTDPRVLKGLYLAMQASANAKVTKQVENVQASQKTKPAKNVGGAAPHARRPTDASGDGLSTEEWIRRREQERRAAAQR